MRKEEERETRNGRMDRGRKEEREGREREKGEREGRKREKGGREKREREREGRASVLDHLQYAKTDPFLHTASDQALKAGKAWERGYQYFTTYHDDSRHAGYHLP